MDTQETFKEIHRYRCQCPATRQEILSIFLLSDIYVIEKVCYGLKNRYHICRGNVHFNLLNPKNWFWELCPFSHLYSGVQPKNWGLILTEFGMLGIF